MRYKHKSHFLPFSLLVLLLLFALNIIGKESEAGHKLEELREELVQLEQSFQLRRFNDTISGLDLLIKKSSDPEITQSAKLLKGRCLLELQQINAAGLIFESLQQRQTTNRQIAAWSIFHLGECRLAENRLDDAQRLWNSIIEDNDLKGSEVRAESMLRLIELAKQGKNLSRLLELKRSFAVEYRTSRPVESYKTIENLLLFYVRNRPSFGVLTDLYADLGGFGERKINTTKRAEDSQDFWNRLIVIIQKHGQFQNLADEKTYFEYWSGHMAGRFPEWDEFQISLASFILKTNRNAEEYANRLLQIYKSKPTEITRTIQFMRLFENSDHFNIFYNELKQKKISLPEFITLFNAMTEMRETQLHTARIVELFGLQNIPDTNKIDMVRKLWHRDFELAEKICNSFENKNLAAIERLQFLFLERDSQKGLLFATKLQEIPEIKTEVERFLAEFLLMEGEYEQAAKIFLAHPNQPSGILRAAESYRLAGNYEKALQLVDKIIEEYPTSSAQALSLKSEITKTSQSSKSPEISAM